MRADYVNFFWSGKMPSFRGLFDWEKHLQLSNSDFQVCLWVDNALYQEMKAKVSASKEARWGDVTFVERDGVLFAKKFRRYVKIENFTPLLEAEREKYLTACAEYDFLIENRLFSFASSFARMLILNKYPGFYCDFDVRPTSTPFPKSIGALKELTKHEPGYHSERLGFFLNASRDGTVENQIMLTLDEKSFDSILFQLNYDVEKKSYLSLERMKELTEIYQKAIEVFQKKVKENPFYIPSPTQTDNQLYEQMTRYRQGGYAEGEGDEIAEYAGAMQFQSTEKEAVKKIDAALIRFQNFYFHTVKQYYGEFKRQQYPKITQVFDDCFKDPMDDGKPVFTWSHPSHFRLEKLKKSANVIGAAYKRGSLNSNSLLDACHKELSKDPSKYGKNYDDVYGLKYKKTLQDLCRAAGVQRIFNNVDGRTKTLDVMLEAFRAEFKKIKSKAEEQSPSLKKKQAQEMLKNLGLHNRDVDSITHYDLLEIGLSGCVFTEGKTPDQILFRNNNLRFIYAQSDPGDRRSYADVVCDHIMHQYQGDNFSGEKIYTDQVDVTRGWDGIRFMHSTVNSQEDFLRRINKVIEQYPDPSRFAHSFFHPNVSVGSKQLYDALKSILSKPEESDIKIANVVQAIQKAFSNQETPIGKKMKNLLEKSGIVDTNGCVLAGYSAPKPPELAAEASI